MSWNAARRYVPGLALLRPSRETAGRDVVAGLVLIALLVPAGMGYAQAAGLPPETGLYATIIPMLVYALVGPSRVLVVGPDSALAPIIAAAVLPLAGGDGDRAVALAGLLALMIGALLLAGGAAGVGFLTDLISKPIRIGYLNGIAVVVIVGQIPKLLGFSIDADSLAGEVREIVRHISEGDIDGAAATFGAAALAVLIAARAMHKRIGPLVVVAASTALVYVTGWDDTLPVVGAMPRGVPGPQLDGLEWGDVTELIWPALGIALIAFADTSAISRTMAARQGRGIDGNHEMAAIGAANVGAGAFGGFPISASSSRTPVAADSGATSQLAGVVAALGVLLFLIAAPNLTAYLPSAVLGAVIVVAASGLVDWHGVLQLARIDRVDAALCLAAFIGVTFVGVLEGIAVAVALSLIEFVHESWRPYRAELGRVPGLRGYHDLSRHPDAERLPHMRIVRFDAPLFFANAGIFNAYVRSVVDAADHDVNIVILAAEPITDIDTTAADELVKLDDVLRSRGIRLLFAEMKDPVRDQLRRYGLDQRFGSDRFLPTVGAAVDAITGEFRGDIEPPP